MPHVLNHPARLSAIAISVGLLAASVGLVVAPTPAHAATLTVTTTADVVDAASCGAITAGSLPGPDGFVSLREATCLANRTTALDRIELGAGTYVLTAGMLEVNYDLELVGATRETTTIETGGADRVIDAFPFGASLALDIRDVTLRGGDVSATWLPDGGVLSLWDATTHLERVRVADGIAEQGGGIANFGGQLTVLDTEVVGNTALGNGGGVFSAGELRMQWSTIAGNTADGGGGISLELGAPDVSSIEQSTISGNTAGSRGGGIFLPTFHQGLLTVTDTTISGNSAALAGGGIGVQAGAASELLVLQSTVTGNTASVGGGIAQLSGGVTVDNSIVAANSAEDVAGIVDGTGNLVGIGAGALLDGVGDNVAGTPGSPLDPQLRPLADNGGFTLTHLPLPTSPAIDSAPAAPCNAVDQRGVDRFQSAGCDRGAVELTFPDTWFTSVPSAVTGSTAAALAFSGSGDFGPNDFECSLDSAAFATCTSPLDLSGLAEGPHELRVRALDEFGGVDVTSASASWTVDTTGPVVTWGSVELGTTPGSASTLAFTADDVLGDVEGFECSLDGAAFTACSSPVTTPGLAAGLHNLRVRAIDGLGNAGVVAERGWTVVAAVPPVVDPPVTVPTASEVAETGAEGVDTAFAAAFALLLAGGLLVTARVTRRRA